MKFSDHIGVAELNKKKKGIEILLKETYNFTKICRIKVQLTSRRWIG